MKSDPSTDTILPPQASQLATIHGCRVVAIAGGADKCRWLREEIGIKEVLDYKDPNFKKNFREVGYLDVYLCVHSSARLGGDGTAADFV
jgi:NADPH:quinone reductase-like Zn-dependent oxidoreductase